MWAGVGLAGGAILSCAFPPAAPIIALPLGAVVGGAIGAVRNYQAADLPAEVKGRVRHAMYAKLERDYKQLVGPILKRLVNGLGIEASFVNEFK